MFEVGTNAYYFIVALVGSWASIDAFSDLVGPKRSWITRFIAATALMAFLTVTYKTIIVLVK